MRSINPATGQLLASFEEIPAATLERKLALAADTFTEWRSTTVEHRASLMLHAAALLEAGKRELGRLMTLEMGKPIGAAIAEAEKCAWVCRYYAGNAAAQLADEEVATSARRSFIAYLACHNRPIHEVLFPALRDVSGDYERTFLGMTAEPVELSALLSARERMVGELQTRLDANEREFLLSLARNEPDWTLLGIGHLEELPGIRWKLRNIEQLARTNPRKLNAQADELERLLAQSMRG